MLAVSSIHQSTQATPSELWGADGSKWNPASRLPDFSFAGYHCDGRAIPGAAPVVNIKTYGAVGDGRADDTAAFCKAVESATGVIFVPEGRYVLTNTVKITRSNVVLRGAGIGRTVLVIPKSLQQINGSKVVDKEKSYWSFWGGFIEIKGGDKGVKLAEVASPAKRGDTQLIVKTGQGLAPGKWVRLLMNNDPALGRHLHAGLHDASQTTRGEMKHLCDWVACIKSVNGNAITLDRPLRLDVNPEWKAELWSWMPTVQETGVESLSFEFAGAPKKPHSHGGGIQRHLHGRSRQLMGARCGGHQCRHRCDSARLPLLQR